MIVVLPTMRKPFKTSTHFLKKGQNYAATKIAPFKNKHLIILQILPFSNYFFVKIYNFLNSKVKKFCSELEHVGLVWVYFTRWYHHHKTRRGPYHNSSSTIIILCKCELMTQFGLVG